MGARGLRRFSGAHFFAARPRLLRSRAPLAQRQERRNSRRVRVFLYYIGKARDPATNRIAADFVERSARFAPCEMREIQPGRFDPWARHSRARKIFLDPAGREMDSHQFTALVEKSQMEGR